MDKQLGVWREEHYASYKGRFKKILSDFRFKNNRKPFEVYKKKGRRLKKLRITPQNEKRKLTS